MTTIDLLGHLGYVLLFFGQLGVARKNSLGWLGRLGGELVWLVIGIYLGLSSIILWGSIFLMVDLYGWYRSGKQ